MTLSWNFSYLFALGCLDDRGNELEEEVLLYQTGPVVVDEVDQESLDMGPILCGVC